MVIFDSGVGQLTRVDGDRITRARFDTRGVLGGNWSIDHRAVVLGGSLIFGDKLSKMYSLDIEMLLKTGVECVQTIGPRRSTLSSLELAQEQYGSRIQYGLAVVALYTTTTQVHPSVRSCY